MAAAPAPIIDTSPHLTWRATAAALRLPAASLRPGQGRNTLLSTAAARVQQLDAVRLDAQLLMILEFQLRKVILSFGPMALSNWKPEVPSAPTTKPATTCAQSLPAPAANRTVSLDHTLL